MSDYTPDFNETNPIVHPTSDADLDINFDRALLVFYALLNAGSLAPDLIQANASIASLSDPSGLAALINSGTRQTLTSESIPVAVDIHDASLRCGAIGFAFLEAVKQLWGLNDELALTMVAREFQPEVGLTANTVLTYVSGGIAILGLLGLTYATLGSGAPIAGVQIGTILTSLAIAGGSVASAQLYEKISNGEISTDEAIGEAFLILVFTAAGVKGASLLNMARFQKLSTEARRQLGLFIEWSIEAGSNTMGVPTSYSGNLESIIEFLVAAGFTRDEAVTYINSASGEIIALQQDLNSLTITPTEDATHSIPTPTPYVESWDHAIDPATGEQVSLNLNAEQNAWFEARLYDYRRAAYGEGVWEDYVQQLNDFNEFPYVYERPIYPFVVDNTIPNFFNWLNDQDIPYPPGITDDYIDMLERINIDSGPCTPTGQ